MHATRTNANSALEHLLLFYEVDDKYRIKFKLLCEGQTGDHMMKFTRDNNVFGFVHELETGKAAVSQREHHRLVPPKFFDWKVT